MLKETITADLVTIPGGAFGNRYAEVSDGRFLTMIRNPPQSSQYKNIAVLFQSGLFIAAFMTSVTKAWPSLIRAVGCSLFVQLGFTVMVARV